MADLPIQVIAGEPLPEILNRFEKIREKLSARLNFVAMGAGWYSDESTIIDIVFKLVSNNYLETNVIAELKHAQTLADDVVYIQKSNAEHIECYVAITQAESVIISTNSAVIYPLLETKLIKILSLLAKKLALNEVC